MKKLRIALSIMLTLCMLASIVPAMAAPGDFGAPEAGLGGTGPGGPSEPSPADLPFNVTTIGFVDTDGAKLNTIVV